MYNTYELNCGVKLFLTPLPIHRSASIGFWVKTGSIHEPKVLNGISHFIEHMLFKGTSTRTARDIAEFFDSRGADLNAFTSKECTCYHAKVLDHHLVDAIEVISDMICNSLFTDEEIEKEKNVIIDEITMADDTSDDVSYDLIAKASFGKCTLGQPILGFEESVQSFTSSDIRTYMDHYYTSDKIVISIAGSFNESAVIKALNKFLTLKVGVKKETINIQEFYSQGAFISKDIEQVHLEVAYPGLALGDEKVFPMAALNVILGGSVSSRLFQNIREKYGLTYSINSYLNQYENIGTLNLYANMQKSNLKRVVDLLAEEIKVMLLKGVTDEELKRAKEQLKGNYILDLEGSESYMGLIGKNTLFNKKIYTVEAIELKINAIDMKDLNDIIQETLKEKPAVSIVGKVNQKDLDYCIKKLGVYHD